jgi:hypothetical protein
MDVARTLDQRCGTTTPKDAEIDKDVLPIFTADCHPSMNELEDLFILSACCQGAIDFYRDYVCTSIEQAKQIYVHTKEQNNLTWRKFRQVMFAFSISSTKSDAY